MQKTEKNKSEAQGQPAASAGKSRSAQGEAWYAGPYKEALIYLMVAIFFVELMVGGVSFFYGVMHAAPEVPGGPPMARFPWLGWAVAAVLAPVGLMLIVHLSGTWVSRYLGREDGQRAEAQAGAQSADDEQVPERLRRFYAIIRNSPTVVLLLGIMLLGAGLFFVDGAFSAIVRLGSALTDYIPWIAGSLASMIAVCYLVHRWFMYRHHRMQQEYEYRREVLERTGIVLVDKGCIPLPQNEMQRLALGGQVVEAKALPAAVDVESDATDADATTDTAAARAASANHDDDVTDAEIISPESAEDVGSAEVVEKTDTPEVSEGASVGASEKAGTAAQAIVEPPSVEQAIVADHAQKPQNRG